MAGNDLFGGLGNLGGILGGIAKSVVPKDTPEGRLLAAQTELADLQQQETELLLEIGKQAYAADSSAWPQDTKLQLIRENITSAREALDNAQQEKEHEEAAKAAEDAKGRCPQCGHKNPEGTKFCQECGTPQGAAPRHCTSCGAELKPGVRFCGECGARQGEE